MPLPQNGEDAAYASFALCEALIGILVAKGVISLDEINSIIEGVADTLAKAPNNARNRIASLLRDTMLSKKDLG
jgi:hypothetical protein